MNITFKDIKRQCKWTYRNVQEITMRKHYLLVEYFNDLQNSNYIATHDYTEFDSIELEKSEDEA